MDDYKSDLVICCPGCGYHLLRELCSDCTVFRTHWCVQHAVWFSSRILRRGQGWANPILNIRGEMHVNSSLISIAFCVFVCVQRIQDLCVGSLWMRWTNWLLVWEQRAFWKSGSLNRRSCYIHTACQPPRRHLSFTGTGIKDIKVAVSDIWETLLIFKIPTTNTPLPKRINPLSW